MSTSGKPRRPRYSEQVQQEDLSEAQLRGRLAKVRWPVDRFERDLGEDLRVRIFDQGTSTGLSFCVQLKSVLDAERRKRKRGPEELRYRLEVKDLERWEEQAELVVLLVWDVERQAGYWQTIPAIIEALDARDASWRERKTVTVPVPAEQGTDDRGLQQLRWVIADRSLPLVARRSPITLRFTEKGGGKEAWSAFQEAIDRGTRVVSRGAATPEIEMPAWHRRLYGARGQVERIEVTSRPPDGSIPVRVEVRSAEGAAALPYVDLRVTRQGRKESVLSNEHQHLPFALEVALIEGGDSTLRLWPRRFGSTVHEAREVAAFSLALTRPGSRIGVYAIDGGQLLSDSPIPDDFHYHAEQARVRLEALDKLAFIEPRIAVFGSVSLARGINEEDIATIDLLHRACRDGKRETILENSFEVDIPADKPAHWPGPEGHFELQGDGAKVTLLGVEIPLGRVKVTFVDQERVAAMVRQAIERARATGKPAELRFENARIIEEFLDWPRPADRLHDLASTQSGYFTLVQAFEAGFAAATQVETELRVERCSGDIFRMLQFPPSEHEDLVILWLQTETQGVFSHDTALALNQLSDILPSRRHVTVPPGWEPPPNARLDRGTVLHHAEVIPSEITWFCPIPFTKALRTIRDCIEKGVSPEIIEQAIAEALERGMITQAEVQDLRLARARSA
ncbi:uncharacterized protein SOCE26_077040 [Sorangium cellulosum]|uniref:DUF4365 domain-containing protein n=1 Tax=Sorangium cellulosum TaxID=56 RepID=A0A2L0F423_SORCE|nr:DUF4365 domain-containing protein [Sorangium cellulosum]AUX46199.1 uncharacterized protein SOCE26_077040 [Sorangium cellulosum]